MIKKINESKIHSRKCNTRQKWNNDKCQCRSKNPIRHRICEEDYVWNPSKRACEFNKDFEIR